MKNFRFLTLAVKPIQIYLNKLKSWSIFRNFLPILFIIFFKKTFYLNNCHIEEVWHKLTVFSPLTYKHTLIKMEIDSCFCEILKLNFNARNFLKGILQGIIAVHVKQRMVSVYYTSQRRNTLYKVENTTVF